MHVIFCGLLMLCMAVVVMRIVYFVAKDVFQDTLLGAEEEEEEKNKLFI